MEEPNYITIGQLKKELEKYSDDTPVVGIDNEDGVGLYEFGVVRIC